jgi:hypothetical protein
MYCVVNGNSLVLTGYLVSWKLQSKVVGTLSTVEDHAMNRSATALPKEPFGPAMTRQPLPTLRCVSSRTAACNVPDEEADSGVEPLTVRNEAALVGNFTLDRLFAYR